MLREFSRLKPSVAYGGWGGGSDEFLFLKNKEKLVDPAPLLLTKKLYVKTD